MAKVLKGSKRGKQAAKTTARARRARRTRRRPAFSIPFGATCDGRLMINAADCRGYDLRHRKVLRGVILTRQEARSVFKTLDHGPLAEAASNIIRKLPRRRTKSG